MRIWHKDLIPVLPRQQLLGQWRELCCIAKNIAEKGTPNHMLVNKVMDYPSVELTLYAQLVFNELRERGYKCDWYKFMQYRSATTIELPKEAIFSGWHNYRYFLQCYFNLQEKYDCGGICEKEWERIQNEFVVII